MERQSLEPADYFRQRSAVEEWSKDVGLYETERHVIGSHFPTPGSQVLDIGCGAGRTTAALVELGYRVTAIDTAPEMVESAKSRAPGAQIVQMDAGRLTFPDRTFDAVMFSFNGLDGLYPVTTRWKSLGEMARVARPGGIVYYTGHNWLGQLGRVSRGTALDQLRQIARFFSVQPLVGFLQGYGLYRDDLGAQMLYHRSPIGQVRQLARSPLKLIALYGNARFKEEGRREVRFRQGGAGPRLRDLLLLSLLCAHVHYVLRA